LFVSSNGPVRPRRIERDQSWARVAPALRMFPLGSRPFRDGVPARLMKGCQRRDRTVFSISKLMVIDWRHARAHRNTTAVVVITDTVRSIVPIVRGEGDPPVWRLRGRARSMRDRSWAAGRADVPSISRCCLERQLRQQRRGAPPSTKFGDEAAGVIAMLAVSGPPEAGGQTKLEPLDLDHIARRVRDLDPGQLQHAQIGGNLGGRGLSWHGSWFIGAAQGNVVAARPVPESIPNGERSNCGITVTPCSFPPHWGCDSAAHAGVDSQYFRPSTPS
jgi:hypothetical protein